MPKTSIALAFSILSLLSFSRQCRADDPVPTLEEIIPKVATAEHAIRNLAIHDFVGRFQTADSEVGEWKDTGESVSGDAWYNGMLASKARVNFTSMNHSEDPNAPLREWQEEVSWNGKSGRDIRLRWGPPGRAADVHSATIMPSPPAPLATDGFQRYLDGSGLCLNFYRAGTAGFPLSVRLQRALDSHVPLKVQWEPVLGAHTLRVQLGDDPLRCSAWWLDVDHGYALRRAESWYRERADGPRLNLLVVEVQEISDAGAGIWVPTRGVRDEQLRPDYRRLKFESKRVVANDPNFDEGVFTAPIPPRFLVDDQTTGKTFYTSDATATTQAVDQAVQELRAQ